MRVLIDTNILVSAALNPGGTPYRAYLKAVSFPNQCYVSDQNIDELRRVFNRKFPHKIDAMEAFLALALNVLKIIPTPVEEKEEEGRIRDPADRPILRAATGAGVDAIVTGDRDFLESGIVKPRILTTAQFVGQEHL